MKLQLPLYKKFNLPKFLYICELTLIKESLKMSKNDCQKAAELLGIPRTTLVEKRRKFGLLHRKNKKVENQTKKEEENNEK